MDKAQQRRWMVLGFALCATVAAIIYPTEQEREGQQLGERPQSSRSQSRLEKGSTNTTAILNVSASLSEGQATKFLQNSLALLSNGKENQASIKKISSSDDIAFHGDDGNSPENADPFAPRVWQAPQQPIVQQQVQVATAVIEATAPAAPVVPPLPFRFMGRLSGDGEPIVYLNWGDKAYIAKKGEVFDNTYKVLDVTADAVEFEYLATKDRQTMPIASAEN